MIRALLGFSVCILSCACRPLGVKEIFPFPKTCVEYEFEKKTQVSQSAALLYDSEQIYPPLHAGDAGVFEPVSIHLHLFKNGVIVVRR